MAYLGEIGVAADLRGQDGVPIPTGSGRLDPWVVAVSGAPLTRRRFWSRYGLRSVVSTKFKYTVNTTL
ncbi:hypothetical protein QFZ98_006659 [Paraburkholderia youngii]